MRSRLGYKLSTTAMCDVCSASLIILPVCPLSALFSSAPRPFTPHPIPPQSHRPRITPESQNVSQLTAFNDKRTVAYKAFHKVCCGTGMLDFLMVSYSSDCRDTANKCDIYFTFCFDTPKSSPSINSCAFHRTPDTDTYDNQNNIQFGSTIGGIANPIRVNISTFSNPNVMVVIRVMDENTWLGDDHKITVARNLTLSPAVSRGSATYSQKTFSLQGHTCVCPSAWSGPTCTEDVDECSLQATSPCNEANTAECRNLNGSFQCVCLEGWRGENCEQDVDECGEGVPGPQVTVTIRHKEPIDDNDDYVADPSIVHVTPFHPSTLTFENTLYHHAKSNREPRSSDVIQGTSSVSTNPQGKTNDYQEIDVEDGLKTFASPGSGSLQKTPEHALAFPDKGKVAYKKSQGDDSNAYAISDRLSDKPPLLGADTNGYANSSLATEDEKLHLQGFDNSAYANHEMERGDVRNTPTAPEEGHGGRRGPRAVENQYEDLLPTARRNEYEDVSFS
ncbi:hypothetical protein BaRGS_00012604 [Batillaria attramentaria]|uniref:EGF-like domain-containing protein n=1 Tax=Batillaria attramentaria TaxID=370345 RepID=A0ABD0LAN4_9CAEN